MVLVTAAFEAGARATARARGFERLPIVTFAADLEELADEVLRVALGTRLDEIEQGLRRG